MRSLKIHQSLANNTGHYNNIWKFSLRMMLGHLICKVIMHILVLVLVHVTMVYVMEWSLETWLFFLFYIKEVAGMNNCYFAV